MELLRWLGITYPDRQDKSLCYVVTVGSILNQPSLCRLGHHQPYFLIVEFLFRATRTPVDVSAVLDLSSSNTGSSFSCLGACAQAAVESTAALALYWILSAKRT